MDKGTSMNLLPPYSEKVQQIFDRTKGHCAYCGCLSADLTVDHMQPKRRGGTQEIGNLILACRSCNSSKKNRTVEEYREWLAWQTRGGEFNPRQREWLQSAGIELPALPGVLFWFEMPS